MRTRTLRLLALAAFAALGTACGGGGGGGGMTPTPSGTNFVPFFTAVFQTSNQGTAPVSLTGIAFTNRFPADESTFNGLLP